MTSRPIYRTVVAVDLEQSTRRPNPVKEELRRETYRIVEAAMDVAGIPASYCDPFVDRGDGVLILVRPVDEVPKTLLLHPLIPVLTHLLIDYNTSLPRARRASCELRLRAVIHCGEVHRDGNGLFGETLDVACRLLDAPRLKRCLRYTGAPLVLVVSDDIYKSIVQHGYDGISPNTFTPLWVDVAGHRRRGWFHVPAAITTDPQHDHLVTVV